jgi:hypothetical protein
MADAFEIETLIREFEERQRDLLTAFSDKLRAAMRATSSLQPPHELDGGLTDLMPAADAAKIARRAKPTMNEWCRKHPIRDKSGFARQIGKRWFVSKSRLLRHLASGLSD